MKLTRYAVRALWDEVRMKSQTMLQDEIYKNCTYRIRSHIAWIESHGVVQIEKICKKMGCVSDSMCLNPVCHHLHQQNCNNRWSEPYRSKLVPEFFFAQKALAPTSVAASCLTLKLRGQTPLVKAEALKTRIFTTDFLVSRVVLPNRGRRKYGSSVPASQGNWASYWGTWQIRQRRSCHILALPISEVTTRNQATIWSMAQ